MSIPLSAIPPVKLPIETPSGPQVVTLRLTNHSRRVLQSKLSELGLLGVTVAMEAARQSGEDTTALLMRFARERRLDPEKIANQLAAFLYAMTRYDNPELEWRDCQAAVPFENAELEAFADKLKAVFSQFMPEAAEPKPGPVDATKSNPTKPATGPARGGKRTSSKSHSRK